MTEQQARRALTCPGCGTRKLAGPSGMIVCWGCWRGETGERPAYKYFLGTLDQWLQLNNRIAATRSGKPPPVD
jgi:hypothetical protein